MIRLFVILRLVAIAGVCELSMQYFNPLRLEVLHQVLVYAPACKEKDLVRHNGNMVTMSSVDSVG